MNPFWFDVFFLFLFSLFRFGGSVSMAYWKENNDGKSKNKSGYALLKMVRFTDNAFFIGILHEALNWKPYAIYWNTDNNDWDANKRGSWNVHLKAFRSEMDQINKYVKAVFVYVCEAKWEYERNIRALRKIIHSL